MVQVLYFVVKIIYVQKKDETVGKGFVKIRLRNLFLVFPKTVLYLQSKQRFFVFFMRAAQSPPSSFSFTSSSADHRVFHYE